MGKPNNETKAKTVELWPGKTVELVRPELLNDFDFICDVQKAQKDNDVAECIRLYFVLVGGDEVYNEVRQYLIKKTGIFDVNGLLEIAEKIGALFPKAQSSSQRRW